MTAPEPAADSLCCGTHQDVPHPEHGALVTLCTDGPLLLRGDFEITDARGNPIDARRGTVALCRCGGSAIKPFCDGTHKLNGFTTES